MTEWVDDVTLSVAVDLVLRGPLEVRAELHRPRDNVVDVLYVDVEEDGGAGKAVGRRRVGPEFGGLLLEMRTESPISISAWATVPSGLGKRIRSVASNTSE